MDPRNTDPGIVGGAPPEGFQLDVRAHGFDLTDALRQYAVDHIGAKLAKHARQIQSVVIRFDDVNGSKGGVDKRCSIDVFVRGGSTLVIDELDQDLRAAMDRAADRVQSALAHQLGRKRSLPRQRGRKLVRARKTIG